jgi:hypothetical protein
MDLFAAIQPRQAETAAELPGDEIVADATVVMDRAFSLPAPPHEVWPWFVQLGKRRGGWYLPRSVERLIPAGRRATRELDPRLQGLAVGDVIPDWGGKSASFEVAQIDPPRALVHRSTRGELRLSWAIVLRAQDESSTRVQIRLRLGGVRHRSLARSAGGFFDALTIAGLAAGLRQRMAARAES